MLHTARCKYRTKKVAQNRHLHHRTTLSDNFYATKAHNDNRKKNFLSSNISSRCCHNMVNFGPLAAEIDPVAWGIPANFNGFRVLAALMHGTPVLGVSQTAALNRRRHLCSAGRPCLALAHILSVTFLRFLTFILNFYLNVCYEAA